MKRMFPVLACLLATIPVVLYAQETKPTNQEILNAALQDEVDAIGGSCKSYVQTVMSRVGVSLGSGYRAAYLKIGTEISGSEAVPGDIIQTSNDANPEVYVWGYHTAIIQKNNGDGTFDVIDSNWGLNNKVQYRDSWNPYTWVTSKGVSVHIYRLGRVETVISPPRLPAGTFHKQANSSTVYLATADGRIWPVMSGEILFALTGKRNDYSMVQNHPANSLDKYIKGPIVGQKGTLYKDSRIGPNYPAVYLVFIDEPRYDLNNELIVLGVMRPIQSGQVFDIAQFSKKDILPVPEAMLNKYIHGELFTLNDITTYYNDASPEALAYLADQIAQAGEDDGSSLVQLAAFVDQGQVLGATVSSTGNTNTGSSSGAGNPEQYPTEISMEPMSIDFGEVEIGESASRFITIKNIGRGNAEITADFPYSPYLPQFSFASQRFTISPGNSQKVEAVFTPSSTLSIAGVFEINSGLARISMSGHGKRTTPRQIITIKDTLSNGMILESVLIKAGSVLMGAAPDDPYQKIAQIQSNERPQQLVSISKDFGLGKYEFGTGGWQAIVGNIPLTWNNVNNIFLPKLNELAAGKAIFRIPTEAEWELAARDGSHTRWFFGPEPNSINQYAHIAGDVNEVGGTKDPSPNGLYDIYGTYAEMTRSLGGYETRRYSDPVGLSGCMTRGGSWQDDFVVASSVYRRSIGPNDTDICMSFRLLREIPDAPVVASNSPAETAALPDTAPTTSTGNAATSTSGNSQTQSTEITTAPVVDPPAVVILPPPTATSTSISLPAPTLFSPPNNATETPTRPDLVWTNSTPGNTYELQVSTNPSFTPPMAFETYGGFDWYGIANRAFPWSRSEYVHVDTLANNTTYYWRVKSQGGDWSQVSKFTTFNPCPLAPSGFSTRAGDGWVALIWRHNTEKDIAGYSVHRSLKPEFIPSKRDSIAWVAKLSSSYFDRAVRNGISFYYRIIAIDSGGKRSEPSKIVSATPLSRKTNTKKTKPAVEYSLFLGQNFPNPFNPETIIRYSLPEAAVVHLSVYDLSGHEVAVLVSEQQEAGVHSIVYDASNLPSGVYLYRLQSGSFTETKRMILIK